MDVKSHETCASPIRRANKEDVSNDEATMDETPSTPSSVATTIMTCQISQHSNGATISVAIATIVEGPAENQTLNQESKVSESSTAGESSKANISDDDNHVFNAAWM